MGYGRPPGLFFCAPLGARRKRPSARKASPMRKRPGKSGIMAVDMAGVRIRRIKDQTNAVFPFLQGIVDWISFYKKFLRCVRSAERRPTGLRKDVRRPTRYDVRTPARL